MQTIGIIDFGMGNLHSLSKAIQRVAAGQRVVVSYDPEELRGCDRLVLPGVGGVKACMKELNRLELAQLVIEASKKVPMLGICLGMQVMLEFSEENDGVPALGLFPGAVVRFPEPPMEGDDRLKVPHMGWNRVQQRQPHPVWEGIPDESWFYFVHSYFASPKNPAHVLGTAEYTHNFAAAIARENLVAFQFHPEKSQALGLRLLANFVNWSP